MKKLFDGKILSFFKRFNQIRKIVEKSRSNLIFLNLILKMRYFVYKNNLETTWRRTWKTTWRKTWRKIEVSSKEKFLKF